VDERRVPPFVITVSGGLLTPQSIERLTQYVEKYKTGDAAILVLEAEVFDAPSGVKITVTPLPDPSWTRFFRLDYPTDDGSGGYVIVASSDREHALDHLRKNRSDLLDHFDVDIDVGDLVEVRGLDLDGVVVFETSGEGGES